MSDGLFTRDFIEDQRKRLLEIRMTILNGLHSFEELEVSSDDLSDEGDLSQVILSQNQAIGLKERELRKLQDINEALNKIEKGDYGVCEMSGEAIELNRLIKIPWAKLSIESAEQEEMEQKKYRKIS